MTTAPPSKPPTIVKPPTASGVTGAASTIRPSLSVAKPPAAAKPPARPAKTFKIEAWSDSTEGEKILICAKSGMGKTTLAAMAPGAVFMGLDDGGRKIKNPLTGQDVQAIPGITGFQDIRDALHQPNLFPENATIVIDTVTKLEAMVEPYIFENYKQNGKTVSAMRQYGWDGPAHLLDCIRLLLTDLDDHVRAGRNIILLAQLGQISVANSGGLDYLEDGPRLQHNKQYSVRNEVCEWSDHVFQIGFQDFSVVKDSEKAKAGKVVSTDDKRVIHTSGAQHFIAKTRNQIPAVISFDAPSDNALWQFMFEGATTETT